MDKQSTNISSYILSMYLSESIPLGVFGGIDRALKNEVLIKEGNYLEALNDLEIIIFDKTETLTKSVFNVTGIKPNEKYDKDALLEYATYSESFPTIL